MKLNCWIIYVLLLEDDCWYIGQTTSLAFKQRMKHHWHHKTKGALWTRAHKPIRVYSVDTYDRSMADNDIAKIEDGTTLKYAKIYGFESVRGGGYCQREPNWPIIISAKKKKKKSKKNSWDIQSAKRALAISNKLLK